MSEAEMDLFLGSITKFGSITKYRNKFLSFYNKIQNSCGKGLIQPICD